jgi:hypothetical protein
MLSCQLVFSNALCFVQKTASQVKPSENVNDNDEDLPSSSQSKLFETALKLTNSVKPTAQTAAPG